jgi:hypothetical protein
MPAGALPGQGTPQPAPGQAPETGDSLLSGFLQEIPEQHRPILEPYLKKWDGQVTKKFQDIHSQYEPYKQLGDPELLQQAMQIYQTLDQQPEVIYNILREQFEGPAGEQVIPGAEEEEIPPEGYAQLSPEVTQRLEKHEALLQQIAEYVINSHQKSVETEEDAVLDKFINQVKEQHELDPEDEEFILIKLSQGLEPEKAVAAWQAWVQKKAGGMAPKPTPPILSGGGVVPNEQINPKDISRGDLKSFVANILQQANQGG